MTEVLPNESGKIILDLSVKNNKTSLDVLIEKDGKKESVFIDNGGALTNVISMGLRFIVLSRSANRRFLVFDEANKVFRSLGKVFGATRWLQRRFAR